jgi:hypothetical protein
MIVEIEDDKENLLLIVEISIKTHDENKKILKYENIVFQDFFIEFERIADLKFIRFNDDKS